MLVVHKYGLPVAHVLLHIRKGSKLLHFALQGEVPTLWFLVDTTQPTELRHFITVGTGHELPPDRKYEHCGTLGMDEYSLVLHCFEDRSYLEDRQALKH